MEAFGAVMMFVALFVGGIVLGEVDQKGDLVSQCEKIGMFIHKDTVYECHKKETK